MEQDEADKELRALFNEVADVLWLGMTLGEITPDDAYLLVNDRCAEIARLVANKAD